MAIVGARPADPWFLWWRSLGRRAHQRRPANGSGRSTAGGATAGRRTAAVRGRRGIHARADVRPFLLGITLAAGLALFYLSQSAHVAATGYQIASLEARLAEQRAVQQQLISAIGNARSPATITARATAELGLVPLDPAAVEFVPDSIAPPPWSTIDD